MSPGLRGRGPERGVALITALVVTALATAAAVAVFSSVALEVRRAQNLQAASQAWQHALGVEAWALGVLAREHAAADTPAARVARKAPARALPPTAVEAGEVSGSIEPLQGRFNLNALVTPEEGAVAEEQLARLRRLCVVAGVDARVADAIADWLDADQEVRVPGGAEDQDYLLAKPPYRAANMPLARLEELRLVRGVTGEVYARLSPLVTALPPSAGLDVNAASPQVLRSLAPALDEQAVRVIERERPYEELEAFLRSRAFRNGPPPPIGLVVAPEYYEVRAQVRVGDIELRVDSLLHYPAEEAPTVLARRRRGPEGV